MVGLYLVISRPAGLGLLAGLLTLKPIVATPIWIAILEGFSVSVTTLEPAHFLTLLPGAGLTIVIVFIFRPLFSGPTAGPARLLLALDCARWLNSFLLVLPFGSSPGTDELPCVLALIGLALPTVFAVVALVAVFTHGKTRSGPPAGSDTPG